jgi:hypothetical protein
LEDTETYEMITLIWEVTAVADLTGSGSRQMVDYRFNGVESSDSDVIILGWLIVAFV